MGVLAFGPAARRWARTLETTDPDLILTDPSGASSALLAAIDARREGRLVRAGIAIAEPRAALPHAIVGQLLTANPSRDSQRAALTQLAAGGLTISGRPQGMTATDDPRNVQTLREFVRLVDTLVVRSWVEAERIRRILGFMPPRVVRALSAPVPRAEVPKGRGDRIVIWAPELGAAELALYAWALVDVKTPRVIVCREGQIEGLSIRAVRMTDAAAELENAAVVIATDTIAPHDALELAAAGHNVVAPITCGAQEYLDGMIAVENWSFTSVTSAVQRALARRPLTLRTEAFADVPRANAAAEELPTNGPLVSLIVRTVDRPRFLARALASIARQSYRDIEAIVVSDGGPPVDEIVAPFPFARIVRHETSRGHSPAANAGLHAARGEYAALLDDDDLLFADHVARLVGAAQRSGSEVVHADTLLCYLELNPLSDYAVYGYHVGFHGATNLDELYLRDRIAPMGLMAKRELLERIGGFDETIDYAEDWELWIRLAKETDFVHVPVVTSMYTTRSDNSNAVRQHAIRFADNFERIAKRHPVPERPELERTRAAMIATRRGDDVTPPYPEPALRFEPPRPLP